MKTLKVKVVKARNSAYWYADKIGQEFSVNESNGDTYILTKGLGGIYKSDCVIMEDFKIGDRVRVKDECVGKEYRHPIDGGNGTITAEENSFGWISAKLENGEEWSYRPYELILLEDTIKCVASGNEYKLLKDISLDIVWFNEPCKKDWNLFLARMSELGYGWDDVIKPEHCIGIKGSWDDWFVDRRFIEVKIKHTIYKNIYYDPETNRFFRCGFNLTFGPDTEFYGDAHTGTRTQRPSSEKLWRSIPIKSIEDLEKYGERNEELHGCFQVKNLEE